MDFTEKVVIITGAAGDIGRATAKAFSAEGANLVMLDQNYEALLEVANQLKLTKEDTLMMKVDITSECEVSNAFQAVLEKFGRVDVLFNNAGISGKMQPFEKISLAEFEKTLKINVSGVFLGIKYAFPIMKKQKYGSIINTSSDAGERGTGSLSDYIASKHAVNGLTKAAAIEGAPFGLRVNAISPTSTNGSMMNTIMSNIESKEDGFFLKKIPLGRFGEVEEIAQVVLFLASDRASFVTGSSYRIDGGRLSI
ncbi:SDR family NAD(P)-dependent oxidoreductase [Cytobacillus purgationiresistens]|uniref:NAD(P)-dependent dehydrogenase (Short-subunit alcohol dehydrogenase family) n=1 Tax=Cytobacillus purgationiresistens TaxID=863449 RepID=A0ABU0AEB2_9BACI|nr:SDR family NAD(P)-dependent oxidoreductase [Cytobacillus purgationiresistens]MDQ0269589.1 NAD(P)-dependent dehydrogenase (short-subunit alcohol dehydrogenase family) [Cytobacillus purgationiresistens]